MDISQRVQRESVVSEDVLSWNHYSSAICNEMKLYAHPLDRGTTRGMMWRC